MKIDFTTVHGKTTSSGLPVTHSAPLPEGIKGAYVAQGVIYLYGPKGSPKGDVTTMDIDAIVAAAVAKALAAVKK
jgi:hypothetical protein